VATHFLTSKRVATVNPSVSTKLPAYVESSRYHVVALEAQIAASSASDVELTTLCGGVVRGTAPTEFGQQFCKLCKQIEMRTHPILI
jgi:hypothetical protein